MEPNKNSTKLLLNEIKNKNCYWSISIHLSFLGTLNLFNRHEKTRSCADKVCGNFLRLRKFSAYSWEFFSYMLFHEKYYGYLHNFSPIVYKKSLLNSLTVSFSDKLLIIVAISSFHFAEIFYSNKTRLRKIYNFSHVCLNMMDRKKYQEMCWLVPVRC